MNMKTTGSREMLIAPRTIFCLKRDPSCLAPPSAQVRRRLRVRISPNISSVATINVERAYRTRTSRQLFGLNGTSSEPSVKTPAARSTISRPPKASQRRFLRLRGVMVRPPLQGISREHEQPSLREETVSEGTPHTAGFSSGTTSCRRLQSERGIRCRVAYREGGSFQTRCEFLRRRAVHLGSARAARECASCTHLRQTRGVGRHRAKSNPPFPGRSREPPGVFPGVQGRVRGTFSSRSLQSWSAKTEQKHGGSSPSAGNIRKSG